MNQDTIANYNREALRKLQLGLQRLDKAGDDPIILGSALTSLHGALEDHLRAQLAANSRVPTGQRESALDRQKTNWLQLIELLEQYNQLDRSSRQMILRANNLRQGVAHGDDYEGTREELEEYANFVQTFIANETSALASLSEASTVLEGTMKVSCPCGSKCRGADRLGRAPECFVSYSGSKIPYEFRRGEGFWSQVFVGIASDFMGARYEAYQCPTCGCQVLFGSYQSSTGSRKGKVADTCQC